MRSIKKPNYNPKDVFLKCISRVKSVKMKQDLESVADIVSDAAADYDSKAQVGEYYLIDENDSVGGIVSQNEMEKVYTSRMLGKDAPGRGIYDEIKASAPLDKCPLCGQRQVASLDHYLPKDKFPSLVVVPYNLVPSCFDCNMEKREKVPNDSTSQTLHPYYDDVTKKQWLFAKIIQTTPAVANFFVRTPTDWNSILKDRVQHHFDTFKLSRLYVSEAAVAFADKQGELINLFDRGGVDSVREHLKEAALSREYNHLNSWQTALYQAMANSDWFCNGGFRE